MRKKYSNLAQFIANSNAVKFGNFTLKNGKKSNVFFNFGDICEGAELIQLGNFFARFIKKNYLYGADAIFGPAYKGINIAIATSIALFQKYSLNIPYVYNRKAEKDHAEGGKFVGFDLSKATTILVVDDVITGGETKYEIVRMLSVFPNLKIQAIIVGVDREERNEKGCLYKNEFIQTTGIDLFSITTKSKILQYK